MSDSVISSGSLSNVSQQTKFAAESKSNELGQDVFLELMITQMRNQSPLDPQDNSEFVAQLAQFSSVEGLDKLNTTTENMSSMFQSSQALQASSMVGRTVKVNTETAILQPGGAIEGTIEVPTSTSSLAMNVYNSAGQLVDNKFLGPQASGDISFAWSGIGQGGEALPGGTYRFEVLASVADGGTEQLSTALSANINSVSVGNNGTLTLNVAGVGPVSMSSVREIL